MATKGNRSWQSSKKTVLERNCHMFSNRLMSDITPIRDCCEEPSKKCFSTHKYVLATSNPAFCTMFYGSLPERNSHITIRGTFEETLEAFFSFLYTDESDMAPDIALKVLELADQYDIPSLTDHRVDILPKKSYACERLQILGKVGTT